MKTFEEDEMIVASRRGQHSKTISPIVDPDFRAQFITQVRSESCKKGTYIYLRNFEISEIFLNLVQISNKDNPRSSL